MAPETPTQGNRKVRHTRGLACQKPGLPQPRLTGQTADAAISTLKNISTSYCKNKEVGESMSSVPRLPPYSNTSKLVLWHYWRTLDSFFSPPSAVGAPAAAASPVAAPAGVAAAAAAAPFASA